MNHKKKKRRVVFFGDSITVQGAKYGGYIKYLQSMIEASSEEDYDLVGAGVSGDKIYDLYFRLEDDVLAKGAEVVVIFIGINDVWHKFLKLTGTDISRFEAFYRVIVEKLISVGIKVVICTPAVIGEMPPFASEEDVEIDRFSDVIRVLATDYELPLVDLRKAFVNYNLLSNLEYKSQGILTTDGVHLNQRGNQLVAEVMWDVLKSVKVK